MRNNSRRIATLKDLARATGYSINTVSRALRDKSDIAAETKKKIKAVSKKIGYINNTLASSLRLGHTNIIAVILGDISNPHFAIMMKEIENTARKSGYSSFLVNTNENAELEREAIESALNKNVDGIIICPSQHNEENIRYLMQTRVPFVQIGRYFEGIAANYVVCNDKLGGYQAAKYLIDNGHRDILLLRGPLYISSARERLAGYKQAFKKAGLKINPGLVREVPVTGEGCAELISSIIKEKLSFTGILAFSDMIAWDAWTCLEKEGFKIPKDYSLVGFDNIQSRLAIPFQLSTISSYKRMMSSTAVNCLICLMKGKKTKPRECGGLCRHVISTKLVEGETVMRRREKTPRRKAGSAKPKV
ncbi:MAG: LacI family transcriptional regulator [Treponema sp.]|jgi:LacI family transcriptional regulator|nr:LacI family transcriptional regulator [Treponema sp.]